MKHFFKTPVIMTLIGVLNLASCTSGHKIEDLQEEEIVEVINGNTVKLDNGLTVHLLGISANSTMSKTHLAGLIGKTISLIPDSNGDQEFLSFDDEIWAYAMLDETGKPLNRELLVSGGKSAFSSAFLTDSLEVYQRIVKRDDHVMSNVQLGEMLNGASFIIWGKDAEGNTFDGTGFFISRDGLAISCSHVVNYSSTYVVQLSNPDGQIIDKQYSIKRPLYCGNYQGEEDFAIFYVDLDENAKRSLRPLALSETIPQSGSEIFTVGNPGVYGTVLPMSFADGTLANPRPKSGRIQASIDIGPGFSGGAVVDRYGKVIGINQSILVDPNVNSKYVFLTDIMMVRAKLDELNEAYDGK